MSPIYTDTEVVVPCPFCGNHITVGATVSADPFVDDPFELQLEIINSGSWEQRRCALSPFVQTGSDSR